jgi:hypothetical protein
MTWAIEIERKLDHTELLLARGMRLDRMLQVILRKQPQILAKGSERRHAPQRSRRPSEYPRLRSDR